MVRDGARTRSVARTLLRITLLVAAVLALLLPSAAVAQGGNPWLERRVLNIPRGARRADFRVLTLREVLRAFS